MKQKVGIGYDLHRLVEGRKLLIGGIEVPYEKGSLGHSDADVLLHAICDALLGALGKGDIGEHFPDTDPQYKDINSVILLEKVVRLVKNEGFVIRNIDTIIITEEPKLKNYKPEIRKKLSELMDLDQGDIGVKAKTMEGLGPIGNKEAIAAYATVLISKH